MGITVSVPLGAVKGNQAGAIQFQCAGRVFGGEQLFRLSATGLPSRSGLYAPAYGIRPQQPKPPVPDDATILRRMADNGWTRDEAAQELGVSLRHMYRVTRRNKPTRTKGANDG